MAASSPPGQVNLLGAEKLPLGSAHTWPLPTRARIDTRLQLHFCDYVIPGEHVSVRV